MPKNKIRTYKSSSAFCVTNQLKNEQTNSIKQSPSWKASQEIPRTLRNTQFHYPFRNCPPPLSILSQFNPFDALITSFFTPISILSSHISLRLPNGLFPSGFPTKTLYAPLLSPYVPHVPPISLFICSAEYLSSNTNHHAPDRVISSIRLLPSPP
jgi:hypothetical protein